MAEANVPRPGHDIYLCILNYLGYHLSHPEEYSDLVHNGTCYCQNCGRVAVDEKNLCTPAE